MGDEYIKVAAEEGSEDFMEFPIEDNDTLLLSTLKAQFPHAIGLKYRGSSGAWRALSANENVFAPPKGGWADDVVYCVTFSDEMKRKAVVESNVSDMKKMRLNPFLQDLAVMNLPFTTTDAEVKEYFEKNYGPLDYCDVKKFRDTGKSRGYGFIRFKDEAAAKNAIAGEHFFNGRKVEVKGKEDKPMKLFIGRLPDGTTSEDLQQHFSQFGEVTDSWIPTPFKNYGFIKFASAEVAKGVMAETQFYKGGRLNIVERNPDKKAAEKGRMEKNVQNDRNYSYTPRSSAPVNMGGAGASGGARGGGASGGGASGGGGGMNADLKNLLIQVLQNS